jgi:hypothetical protein
MPGIRPTRRSGYLHDVDAAEIGGARTSPVIEAAEFSKDDDLFQDEAVREALRGDGRNVDL